MAPPNAKVFALMLAIAVLCATPSYAAKKKPTPQTGVSSLIIKRDYKGAFASLLARAKTGDSTAQYKLALMYRLGLGTRKDEAATKLWLNKARAGGNISAARLLKRYDTISPPTIVKTASSQTDGGNGLSGPVSFAKLPQRPNGQPDWLTLAVARKNYGVINSLAAMTQVANSANSNLALVTATKLADVPTVQKLMDAKIAALPDSKNRSPLLLAVAMGNEAMTGALLNSTSGGSAAADQNVLSLATENCLPAMVTKLVGATAAKKPQINIVAIAQRCSNWPDFKALLQGADFNALDSQGRTAAWFAAAKGDTSLLAWLVKSGADLSLADKNGLSPLHVAAVQKQTFSVRYILSVISAANPTSARGTTPLMLAAYSGCVDCVGPLLEKSGDLDLKNNDGDTSLMFAVLGRQMATATLLIKQGANKDARNEAGDTPGKLAERLDFPLLQGAVE
jgi:ankyrin repeat protein